MKKSNLAVKWMILITAGVLGVVIICSLFFWFRSGKNPEGEKELTELDRVLTEDLEKNYPDTPRGVVSMYTRIESCYHEKKLTDEQMNKLVDQMRLLWDEDLLGAVSRETYYESVVKDVAMYKQMNRQIANIKIASSNDVRPEVDEKTGRKLAFVDVTYFVKTDNSFTNSFMIFGLRRDEAGDWKILGVTLKEKEDDK